MRGRNDHAEHARNRAQVFGALAQRGIPIADVVNLAAEFERDAVNAAGEQSRSQAIGREQQRAVKSAQRMAGIRAMRGAKTDASRNSACKRQIDVVSRAAVQREIG